MIIGTMVLTMRASWVHSLKEKRGIVKSICGKIQNKFNVSIAEIDGQDTHQMIVIGIACVSNEVSQADSILDTLIDFTEKNTDAEIINIDREII